MKEIIQINRDTLLDRMEASGGYHDQDQYPYGLMDEASKEIKLLRKERDEARREACAHGARALLAMYAFAQRRGWDCFKKEETP